MAYRISTKLLMPISFKKSIMKIDFVSGIACPWCAVGLNVLEIALTRIGDDIPVTLHMQPFELNPDMAKEGVDASVPGQQIRAECGATGGESRQYPRAR